MQVVVLLFLLLVHVFIHFLLNVLLVFQAEVQRALVGVVRGGVGAGALRRRRWQGKGKGKPHLRLDLHRLRPLQGREEHFRREKVRRVNGRAQTMLLLLLMLLLLSLLLSADDAQLLSLALETLLAGFLLLPQPEAVDGGRRDAELVAQHLQLSAQNGVLLG